MKRKRRRCLFSPLRLPRSEAGCSCSVRSRKGRRKEERRRNFEDERIDDQKDNTALLHGRRRLKSERPTGTPASERGERERGEEEEEERGERELQKPSTEAAAAAEEGSAAAAAAASGAAASGGAAAQESFWRRRRKMLLPASSLSLFFPLARSRRVFNWLGSEWRRGRRGGGEREGRSPFWKTGNSDAFS